MHHYFEAITNTSGDSLVGYFARVIDPATSNTITMSADDNGTPIITKSGVENMGSTDDYGNLDFYVVPGTYHLDIYAQNATSFQFRVPNVAMNSTKGDPGEPGATGDVGASDSTFLTLAALKAADPALYPSPRLAALSGADDGVTNGSFEYRLGNYSSAQFDGDFTTGLKVSPNGVPRSTGALVRADQVAKTVNPTPYLRIISDKAFERTTFTDFGVAGQPVGKGNSTWDTAGFNRAIDYLQNYARRQITFADGGNLYLTDAMPIPPGDYITEGGFGGGSERILFKAMPGTVSIRNMADTYFLQTNELLAETYLEGITFYGGRGALNHTRTGANVSLGHRLLKCNFFDYTQAAVTSEAADMPTWEFDGCRFLALPRNLYAGGVTPNAKGIAIGGLLDSLLIRNCQFQRNEYHVQLGPIASGSIHIENNELFSFEEGRTKADLWLIPGDAVPTTASAPGSTVTGNKFGSEGVAGPVAAPRVLVAAKGAGSRNACLPDLTWKDGSDGKNQLYGFTYSGNRLATKSVNASGDGPGASFMHIYCERVGAMTWHADNHVDGGKFDYLFQHFSGNTRNPTAYNTDWSVSLPPVNQFTQFKFGVTDSPIGAINDPAGLDMGPYSVGNVSNDRGAINLGVATSKASWSAPLGGVTLTDVANRDAVVDATQAVWTDPTKPLLLPLTVPAGSADNIVHIVGDVQKAGSNPVTALRIILDYNDGQTRNAKNLQVTPYPDGFHQWGTSAILPADATGCALSIYPDTNSASANSVILGDFRVAVGKTVPTL